MLRDLLFKELESVCVCVLQSVVGRIHDDGKIRLTKIVLKLLSFVNNTTKCIITMCCVGKHTLTRDSQINS